MTNKYLAELHFGSEDLTEEEEKDRCVCNAIKYFIIPHRKVFCRKFKFVLKEAMPVWGGN